MGSNMKTGAMFGNLRNYENLHYYKNNPFIAFDTAYEDGSYVIFSVATIDVTPGGLRYVDLAALSSLSIEPASGSHHRAENAFHLSKQPGCAGGRSIIIANYLHQRR